MISLPTPHTSDRWLLQITIQAARADDTRWREQLAALRSVSSYDPDTQTWSTFIGALNLTAVRTLQALFDVARSFGADIQLEAAPAPASWQGPSFTSDSEVAALFTAQADKGRPLGQHPAD
ncbi:hypothetical protein [Streptomyces olivochromogenes]|uniref:Uncharacterized protein n=1 Tax=Streptomyces olivochromogenes TaxID=1963 RepID=A0A286PH73_STROL|nr:hypothetical protein [Streptomyces olivochromogenes]KUN33096.1 hypothetical protein AQJ27_50885 [Streptomyces olivochromogenes]GAX58902.1 hypothetical protein SO3561_10477 [Streptomyces olivochromogenes]